MRNTADKNAGPSSGLINENYICFILSCFKISTSILQINYNLQYINSSLLEHDYVNK
jgi:hypothetical protein